jgi:hypothetical protein
LAAFKSEAAHADFFFCSFAAAFSMLIFSSSLGHLARERFYGDDLVVLRFVAHGELRAGQFTMMVSYSDA